MINFITISSGFIIPENSLYKRITAEDTTIEAIFSRNQFYNKDFLTKFFTEHNVYSSEIVNNDLYSYIDNPSAKNFYKLVDNALEVFENITFNDFFSIQAENRYLSNICFNFIIDLLKEINKPTPVEINMNSLNQYSYVPYNIRFNFENNLNKEQMDERKKQLKSLLNINRNNSDIFVTLLANKDAFLTFYKFVLADIY